MLPILYALLVLGGLGIVFGVILSFADKVFAVPVDEKVSLIRENVAGANCGACGYAGCDGFAEAVAKGEAPITGCPPGGAKTVQALAEIMGVSATVGDPQVARVLCQGANEIAGIRYEYSGVKSCVAAVAFAGGPKLCQYSCVGLGDCVNVCKFDALKIENNLAVVDDEKCTACGMCVNVCPRQVIELIPRTATVIVRCRSSAGAKDARTACTHACIGCKRCEKACEFNAIHVANGYATIDYDKCTKCGECVKVCPDNCITISA